MTLLWVAGRATPSGDENDERFSADRRLPWIDMMACFVFLIHGATVAFIIYPRLFLIHHPF